MAFIVWYKGQFVKAFDNKQEAYAWAKSKWSTEKIGNYHYCVVREMKQ